MTAVKRQGALLSRRAAQRQVVKGLRKSPFGLAAGDLTGVVTYGTVTAVNADGTVTVSFGGGDVSDDIACSVTYLAAGPQVNDVAVLSVIAGELLVLTAKRN